MPKLVGIIAGACYLVVGVLGFVVVIPGAGWLQNVLHLVVGAALVGFTFVGPRLAASITGTVLLAVGIAGLFNQDTALLNLLHFASAAVLLAVGLGPKRP